MAFTTLLRRADVVHGHMIDHLVPHKRFTVKLKLKFVPLLSSYLQRPEGLLLSM